MENFEVSLDTEHRLVRVVAAGDIFQRDGKEIITTARTVAAENSYGVLYDVRHATPRIPLAEWFHLPRELDVLKDRKTRNIQAAILIAPGTLAEVYKFYELVARNVGLSVRIFFSEDEAMAWLDEAL